MGQKQISNCHHETKDWQGRGMGGKGHTIFVFMFTEGAV